tara:strand:+ start:132422 stop:133381 length:960 start_codon:yes stop_codon:yes gene_type:complete
MSSTDFYSVIGVSKAADADQIKAAFRAKARKLHPDVSQDPDAGKKFSELNEAYEVLSDPEKRAKYDRLGHQQYVSGQPAAHARAQQVEYSDLGSIIDAMFGGSGGGGGAGGFGGFSSGFGGGRPQRPRKGQDLRLGLTVTLLDVHNGATKQISVPSGAGYKSIDVRIPKGIKSGGQLRLKGQGAESPTPGGPAGDVMLSIKIAKDPQFTRHDPEGLDLTLDLPLSIAEATLGGKVEVPTIDGRVVMLNIPPATESESRFRIGGHGLNGASGKRGDLYAKVRIVPPSGAQLTDALREALVEMQGESQGTKDDQPVEESSD